MTDRKPSILICSNREPSGINIRESHPENIDGEFNNAYYCRSCKKLNFKKTDARGLNKHILQIVKDADPKPFGPYGKFLQHTKGKTCCQGGTGYLGSVEFSGETEMLKFLKRYFTLWACDTCFSEKLTEKQEELNSI